MINKMAKSIHTENILGGWWTDLNPREPGVFCTKLILVHSELSEALEGFRKGKCDEHLPHRLAVEVELADAIIRLLDLAGALGLDLDGAIDEKRRYNAKRNDHKPAARLTAGGKKF